MVLGQAGEVLDLFSLDPAFAEHRDNGEGAEGHKRIDGKVQQDTGDASGTAG